MSASLAKTSPPAIEARDIDMAYGSFVLMREITFTVNRGDIFVIMGNSGSGKSTLMRNMTGLNRPLEGDILYACPNNNSPEKIYKSLWQLSISSRKKIRNQFGVMFQNGALFSSMTLLENVSFKLAEKTHYSAGRIRKIAMLKLALVGLKGFENYFPSEISGGMKKRVAIARAMAMDPPILFFDEPSAGLDPLSSKLLDDLLLELRDSMGITMVVVTHELDSIFTIAQRVIFLDKKTKGIIAQGLPRELKERSTVDFVRRFFNREIAVDQLYME